MKLQSLTMVFVSTMMAVNAFGADAKGKGKADAKPAAAMESVYSIDTGKSSVKWVGGKVTGAKHDGSVMLKSGSVTVKNNMITSGQFEIDMNSITNDDLKGSPDDMNKLVGHLKSDDFFNVAAHPTASFKLTSVKPVAGKPNTFDVGGTLTLKGATEKVQFPAEITMTETEAKATAQLEIDRTKWGLKYGSGKFFKGLGDKVINDQIKFELNLTAKK